MRAGWLLLAALLVLSVVCVGVARAARDDDADELVGVRVDAAASVSEESDLVDEDEAEVEVESAEPASQPAPGSAGSSSSSSSTGSSTGSNTRWVYRHTLSGMTTWSGLVFFAEDNPMEVVALLLALVYMANYVSGRRANQRIAAHWLAAQRTFIEASFAMATDAHARVVPSSMAGMYEERGHLFRVGLSGRGKGLGTIVTLQLIAREDLLDRLLAVLSGTRDRVLLESFSEEVDPAFVAVVGRRQENSFKSANADAQFLGQRVPFEALSAISKSKGGARSAEQFSSLVLLSDHVDTAQYFLTDEVLGAINKYGADFTSLHVTDQNKASTVKGVVRSWVSLGSVEAQGMLMRMQVFLADRLCEHKASPAAIARAQKAREALLADEARKQHKEKQEAAMQRRREREDKERAAELEALARLPPGEREKREAKLARAKAARDLKEKQKKFTKVIRVG